MKGDRFQVAADFVLLVLEYAGVMEKVIDVWMADWSKSMMRSRLHGWVLWAEFCERDGIRPENVGKIENMVLMVANFIADMYMEGAKESWRREAMPALYEILGAVEGNKGKYSENPFLRSVIRSCTLAVSRPSKYREIWDLGILLDYLREEGDPSKLSW